LNRSGLAGGGRRVDGLFGYRAQQPHVAVSASVAIAKLMGLMDAPPAANAALIVNISGSDAGLL